MLINEDIITIFLRIIMLTCNYSNTLLGWAALSSVKDSSVGVGLINFNMINDSY